MLEAVVSFLFLHRLLRVREEETNTAAITTAAVAVAPRSISAIGGLPFEDILLHSWLYLQALTLLEVHLVG